MHACVHACVRACVRVRMQARPAKLTCTGVMDWAMAMSEGTGCLTGRRGGMAEGTGIVCATTRS